MIVDVAYSFEALVRAPRARTWNDRYYRGSAPFAVAEIAIEDTPVVAWWTPPEVSGAHQLALRFHQNQYFQPMLTEEDVTTLSLTDAAPFHRSTSRQDRYVSIREPALVSVEAFKDMASVSFHGLIAPLNAVVFHPAPIKSKRPEDDLTAADIIPKGRDAVEAKIARELADLAVIGGVVHRRIDMPVLVARDGIVASGYRTWTNCQTFAISQFEEALAAAYSSQGTPRADFEAPEVVRPDLIPYRHPLADDAAMVIQTLVSEQRQTASIVRPLHSYPLETILAWQALRDSFEANSGTEELLDRLEDYVDALPNDRPDYPTLQQARKLVNRRKAMAEEHYLADLGG